MIKIKMNDMVKSLAILSATVFLLLICNAASFAQSIPDDQTMEQEEKLDQYILDYIRELRVSEAKSQPPMVAEFNKKYTALCLKRAEEEYNKHGRWFYCEDKKEFRNNIRWDEVVTVRTYWQLCKQYGSLKNIPNYSKENHEEAIRFWQSWQLKDGSFCNIFTRKGNGNDSQCNGKYVPGILKLLGSKPLYKTSGYGAVHIQQEARKMLKDGENTLIVRTAAKSQTLDVSAGLIDWKLMQKE